MKNSFILALQNESLQMLRGVEKGDFHNHISRGGTIKKYREELGVPLCDKPLKFDGYNGMESWYAANIRKYFDNTVYLQRIKMALQHMVSDGIKIAVVTYGIKELSLFDSYDEFVERQKELFNEYAPNIQLIPEFGINTNENSEEIERGITNVLKLNFFKSIDIHGPEMTDPCVYKKIYSRAYAYGLKLRAHVGETGEPEVIKIALKELELEEINHGNKAVLDVTVIKEILRRNIRVNLCPYSNIYLGIYNSLKEHPIRILYDYGINLTIGTDDMLIFNKSISEIFLDLYQQQVFSSQELDGIRNNALKF